MQRVIDRLLLADGDAMVVRHQHAAIEILREQLRALAAAAQRAGHGDVDDLLAGLQRLLPAGHDVLGRGLGRGDRRAAGQALEEFHIAHVDVFNVVFTVHREGHGHQYDAASIGLRLGHARIGIGDDACLLHNNTSLTHKNA